MHKGLDRERQAGFTLIELIVVIVILGILAATALPKFADLGADARIAKLRAARGALSSTAGLVHGKWLLDGQNSVSVEGTAVEIQNGYPKATLAFAAAAGLSASDYKLTVEKDSLKIMPTDIATNANVSPTCFIKYSAPSSPNGTPEFQLAINPLICG